MILGSVLWAFVASTLITVAWLFVRCWKLSGRLGDIEAATAKHDADTAYVLGRLLRLECPATRKRHDKSTAEAGRMVDEWTAIKAAVKEMD